MAEGTVKWFNDAKGFGFISQVMDRMYLSTFPRSRRRVSSLWLKVSVSPSTLKMVPKGFRRLTCTKPELVDQTIITGPADHSAGPVFLSF